VLVLRLPTSPRISTRLQATINNNEITTINNLQVRLSAGIEAAYFTKDICEAAAFK
jgi:hypothetical protein